MTCLPTPTWIGPQTEALPCSRRSAFVFIEPLTLALPST